MTNQARNDLIALLKAETQRNPDLTVMKDEELRRLIVRTLKEKQDSGTGVVPASLNFKEKSYITAAVFESIRGLGILGQIIGDPEVTEVMINGYDHIFVERAGRLSRLENHFESRQKLETMQLPDIR